MRDLRGLRRTVIGVLVGTAVLTGCSDKQEANDTLPSSSAAETTEALPPLGPEDFPVPDEARTKDAAGAEAFLRYYIELLNRLQAIPAGEPLRELSPECDTCLRIARAFDDAAAAGWTYDGGEVSLNDVTAPQLNGDTASLVFGARVEALTIRDSTGAPIPNGEEAVSPNAGSGMTLAWSPEQKSWLAAGLTIG
ncbi:DUF6318 family protein [Blastococcus sp. SYSU D00922]